MNALAPVTADGIPLFTVEQAEKIAAFCKARAAKSDNRTFAHKLADVLFAALAVLDGDPSAHGELQALMDDMDLLDLWRAAV